MSVRQFILLSFAATSVVAAAVPASDLPTLQRQAVSLYQAGRYKSAAPLYRRLSDAQPDNRGVLKDYLVVLWLDEQYSEAAEVGARLTKMSPNDVEVWFIYARSLLATGRKEEALPAFKRCRELAPDEKEIQLAEAKMVGALRDYAAALSLMVKIQRQHPDYPAVYPELAYLEQRVGRYSEAADHWAKAVAYFPDKREYTFHEATCLYYSDRQDAAIAKLKVLTAAEPPYWPAIDFLADSALARNDLASARSLLEAHLKTLEPDEGYRLLKLIRIDQKQERWKDVIMTADRWLQLNPRSGTARLLKADALKHLGRYSQAIRMYEEILQENPAASDAWVGIAHAHSADGHPELALPAIEKALVLDPTDPYLLISKVYYLHKTGNDKAHQEILENWIARHPEPPLPILLYHGLTHVPRDPLLASSIHRSTAAFEEDMRTLHEARWTPVDADQVSAWINGQGSLPERPVMITFDDARLDSFQHADPILRKYDLKATMFTPLSSVEGYVPGRASWKDLQRYHATGRWDIQSHGDRAHDSIPVDGEGRRGLFLVNKQWLPRARRLETDDEWATRVRKDHKSSQQKIQHHLRYKPRAFSFPEGNFGQADIANSPEAAPLNLKWAREFFASVYHQDEHGINVRSRGALRLTRYQPPPNRTGKALLRHLTDQPPAVLMLRQLLRDSAGTGQTAQAMHWLDELRKHGVSSSALWADEARIRAAQGNWESARALAEKSIQEDDSPENRQLLEDILHMRRWFWMGRFTFQEDNQHRISRRFRQDLGDWHAAGLLWRLHHIFGTYSERGVPSVTENGGGLRVMRELGPLHRLSLEATGHALSASAKDTYSLFGLWQAAWSGSVRTDLQGGRDLYYYGRALNANVVSHYADSQLRWEPTGDWRASARARLEDLSDDNQRATGILEGRRRLFLPRLWMVARATLDTTERVSPNYYSPQVLQEYQLGPEYTVLFGKGSNLTAAYLPGYGKEKVSDAVLVHEITAVLNLALGPSLTFSPSLALTRQPTYHRNTFAGTLVYRF